MAVRPTARRVCGWQRRCAVALGFLILFRAALPMPAHVTSPLQTLQEHAEFIAEHGHSHGFEEDLAAAFHGHSHDAVEHDHSLAMLAVPPKTQIPMTPGATVRSPSTALVSDLVFQIERPPRA